MKKILSFEEIMQILTQVAENQAKSEAKFEKQMAEDRAKREKKREEDRKALEEYKKQQAEYEAKREKERVEYEAKREKERVEYEAKREKERAEDREALEKLKQLHAKTEKIFGDLGLSQGYIAEDLFYRNVKKVFKKYHKEFHQVYRNLKKKSVAEFDIIAVNNTEVLVLEIKAKLSNKSIDHFTINRLPRFKEFFPQYANYKIIGGVGALIVPDSVEKYAEKQGLYVITQTSDGGASIANKPEFKEKVFA